MISINPLVPSSYTTDLTDNLSNQPGNVSNEKLRSDKTNVTNKKLMQASKSFEALLVNEMLKAMRKNLDGDKLIGENNGSKIFKDFLYSEYSQIISQQADLGLAKSIYQSFQKDI